LAELREELFKAAAGSAVDAGMMQRELQGQ